MVRDEYWKALLFSIGLILGYLTNFEPPSTTIVIRLEIPAQAPQIDSYGERDVRCLRDVIYNESRNQGTAGQIAVGAVVINRVLDKRWKSTICGVTKARGQFASWNPRPNNSVDRSALQKAEAIAYYVLNNYTLLDEELKSYVYFNSGKIKPWAVATIGDHHFGREYG